MQSFWSAHDAGDLPWLVAAAYLLASGLAAWAALRTSFRLESRFWWIAAVGLLFLALNKQLDLQTLLTETLREVATRDGWFEQRRAAQAAFVGAIVLLSLAMAAYLARLAWESGAGVKLTFLGLALLGAYVLSRAALFNHLETPIGRIASDVRAHGNLELGFIVVVIVGEVWSIFRR